MRTSTLFKKQSKNWPEIYQFVVAIQSQEFPNSESELRHIADNLTEALELKVVNTFVHPFKPYGLTLVYVLSQSHLAIHTWPGKRVLHVDLVTCTYLDQREVEDALKAIFNPEQSYFEWL